MAVLKSVVIGYLLGCLSPAALVSKIKKKNLRENGTGNLGATNTMLVFGKGWGVFVMLFDVAKSYIACQMAKVLFPALPVAGVLAGSAAVVGHIFPFYMKFKGGKGLAAFSGLILGIAPLLFPILLAVAFTAMLAVNFTYAAPMTVGPLFPILYGVYRRDVAGTLILICVSILLVVVHIPNIYRAKRGEEVKMREFMKARLCPKTEE